ncbi:MAG: c-type cytochrome [Wolinella sp.]
MRGFWWLVPLVLFADDESFITNFEYGKMLYENPRGIGCINCHGKEGEGSIIAKYRHKGKDKALIAPAINRLSKDEFESAMTKDNKVMPKYHLDKSELGAIFLYIREMNDYSAK